MRHHKKQGGRPSGRRRGRQFTSGSQVVLAPTLVAALASETTRMQGVNRNTALESLASRFTNR
eukprot:9524022-Alexandrium_andersonii.AAC.1